MNLKKYILLIVCFITVHGLAQEQSDSLLLAEEANSDSNRVKSDVMDNTEPVSYTHLTLPTN